MIYYGDEAKQRKKEIDDYNQSSIHEAHETVLKRVFAGVRKRYPGESFVYWDNFLFNEEYGKKYSLLGLDLGGVLYRYNIQYEWIEYKAGVDDHYEYSGSLVITDRGNDTYSISRDMDYVGKDYQLEENDPKQFTIERKLCFLFFDEEACPDFSDKINKLQKDYSIYKNIKQGKKPSYTSWAVWNLILYFLVFLGSATVPVLLAIHHFVKPTPFQLGPWVFGVLGAVAFIDILYIIIFYIADRKLYKDNTIQYFSRFVLFQNFTPLIATILNVGGMLLLRFARTTIGCWVSSIASAILLLFFAFVIALCFDNVQNAKEKNSEYDRFIRNGGTKAFEKAVNELKKYIHPVNSKQ